MDQNFIGFFKAVVALILITFAIQALAFPSEFLLEKLDQPAVNKALIRSNIVNLLNTRSTPFSLDSCNQTCMESLDSVVEESLEWRNQFYRIWNDQRSLGPVKVESYSIKNQFFEKKVYFSIKSLYQREPGHPSNHIKALFFKPYNIACESIPTIVLGHHALDDVSEIESLVTSLMALGNKINILIPIFPQYGDRRAPVPLEEKQLELSHGDINTSFFSTESSEIKENFLQAVLDIATVKSWLLHQEGVDSERVTYVGLSLGGLIGSFMAGFVPNLFPNGIFTMVSGGDIAGIFQNYLNKYPELPAAEKLKNKEFDVEKARLLFAPIDPHTWSTEISTKRYEVIAALQDELLSREESYDKFHQVVKENTHLSIRWINTKHNPINDGLWTKFFDVFKPIEKFINSTHSFEERQACWKNHPPERADR